MKTQLVFRGLFCLGVGLALSLPAVPILAAQDTAGQESTQKKMTHDRLEDAVKQLNLNDDQKTSLKSVFADSKTKRESIMNDTSLSQDQRQDKMKALHQDTMSKVNNILTPEQRDELKSKLAAAKAKNPTY
jgi:periplasmic protein CpxP/Spy